MAKQEGFVTLDCSKIDELQKHMDDYEVNSRQIINDVIHNYAPDIIKNNIQLLVPASGRRWRGKKKAARSAQPWKEDNSEMLETTIRSQNGYHYLYFPDDGSNTYNHAGNKDFTGRGAEASQSKIIDKCLGKLTEAFN